ncbi:hypothetical protein [Actinomadura sp. 9N407]|uniref:hypothetical protein n=1 Tax=Actinomadura sp. 9N407 TaxID=3375154 RepID=UPI00378A7F39
MQHGGRLAVTAGATVLGLVAMSGVGHADSGAPRTGPSLADLTSSLTDTINGLTGSLTGGGTQAPAGTKQTPTRKAPSTSRTPTKPKVVKKATSTKPASDPASSTESNGTKGKARTKAAKAGAQKNQKPGHLRIGLSPELDLKKKTVAGSLVVDAGLNTLLGPAGLKLEADGRLSAEDISIGDPEADGGLKLGTRLGDAGLGVTTRGAVSATTAGVSASGSLNVCSGAGCADAPTPPSPPAPTPPSPPGPTPPGSPSPSPGLPDLPPSSPLLPDLPAAGTGPDVTAASMAPQGDLPFTGADSVSLAALGLTAMVVGGVAVAATRRRTPEES